MNLIYKKKYLFFKYNRIGFKSITTIEKVCTAFPELDMVNHMNRVKLVSEEKKKIIFCYLIYFRVK